MVIVNVAIRGAGSWQGLHHGMENLILIRGVSTCHCGAVAYMCVCASVYAFECHAMCAVCHSHPEGATDAMQSSLTEPMLNNTGNASSTQRLLEGQTDTTTTAKALTKPDAWVQAGKNLFQRATGRLSMLHSCASSGLLQSCTTIHHFLAFTCMCSTSSMPGCLSSSRNACKGHVRWSALHSDMLLIAGNNEKLKALNMGQHILDSLDTPQQLYQVCPSYLLHATVSRHVMSPTPEAATMSPLSASSPVNTDPACCYLAPNAVWWDIAKPTAFLPSLTKLLWACSSAFLGWRTGQSCFHR